MRGDAERIGLPRPAGRPALVAAAAFALMAAACVGGPAGSGSFERTLSVSGPVRLDVQNGTGSVEVRAGESNEVRIYGEIRARDLIWEDPHRRVQEITRNPPVEQHGNVIRVGSDKNLLRGVAISYRITVPADSELQAAVGSGGLEVRGIHGPARLTTGSGGITAESIREDVQATTGSGGITLANVEGEVRATAGSGGITLSEIRGEIRATAGSGRITISEPGGRVTAKTGSGGVRVSGAESDVRASAGSGGLVISGSPTAGSYWELRTGSGSIDIGLPPSASFRLYAHSHSGRIETAMPLLIEEQTKHEMRARAGSGASRIEVRTGSGRIQIR